MDNNTQQFIYRSVIVTVCVITGSIMLFLFISALILGDGEAIKIIGAMLPLLQTLIGAMVTTVLGSHAAAAYNTRQMAQVHIAQLAQGLPLATPATTVAATAATAPGAAGG